MLTWLKNLWYKRSFKKAQSSTQFMSLRFGEASTLVGTVENMHTDVEPKDDREECLPINVISEMEEKVEVSLEDIDKKLGELLRRSHFYLKTLGRKSAPPDLEHAILMLEARKKYPKLEHLLTWRTTTQAKIDALLGKYKLEHRKVADFLPDFPFEAVREIDSYGTVFRKATKGLISPKIELDLSIIAPPALFVKKSKDPILLAKSPFGDYFYILCAWDKEVKFVAELLAGPVNKEEHRYVV